MSDISSTGNDPGALRALLSALIDYAGLFPPAALPLADAVRAYDQYRRSADAWALGRFVVPAARLSEFDALARREVAPESLVDWRLSAILSRPSELTLVRAHNEHVDAHARVDCVEVRAADVDTFEALAGMNVPDVERYVELSPGADLEALLATAREAGMGAKLRTGGVTPDAFPPSDAVLRFLISCRDVGIRVKVTAGLHHAVRGDYPLTYEPTSPCGTMFGWLNVVLAATAVSERENPAAILSLLEDRRAETIELRDEGARWGELAFTTAAIARTRTDFMRAVGSCSFREPLDGARALLR